MPTAYDPRLKAADGLQDTYHLVSFANFQLPEPRDPADRSRTCAKYAGPNQSVTQPVASGYFVAMLFTQILEKVGPKLTSEKFLKVANDNFVFDADGTVAKYSYPNGHKRSRPCASLAYTQQQGVHLRGGALLQRRH